jgi:hypothetical protein
MKPEKKAVAFLKIAPQKTFGHFPPGDVRKSRVKITKIFCGAFF